MVVLGLGLHHMVLGRRTEQHALRSQALHRQRQHKQPRQHGSQAPGHFEILGQPFYPGHPDTPSSRRPNCL
jgi:hypothetical protein